MVDRAHGERHADHDVADEQRGEARCTRASRRYWKSCSSPTPVTSVGSIRGPSVSAIERLPAAEAVPVERKGQRQREERAQERGERAELQAEQSGSIHSGANARSHQRSEKPRGGKNERLVGLNDTAAVMRIGPSEKT